MFAILVSVATAWVVGPVSGPATVQYQPVVSNLPAGYSPRPGGASAVQQLPVVVVPSAHRNAPKLDALNVCAVFGLGAILGFGASRAHAAFAVGGDGVRGGRNGASKVIGGAPKGAFGGSGGPEEGWVGDRGRSEQVQKFEDGTDFLFFQGPAPTTAVQPDLPNFFSAENFSDMKINVSQVAFTVIGFGAAAVLAYLLITG
jgi:hypothetical protein